MRHFTKTLIASAVFVFPMLQACGGSETSSEASNITSNEPMQYTLGNTEYPLSETIRRALASSIYDATLRIADIYGTTGEVEGIAIYGRVWSTCGGFWCVPADKVTKIYPQNGVIFANIGGVSLGVGAYTKNDDGSIKVIEDLCTRDYKHVCDLDYDKGTKVYSFKRKS